MASVTIRNLPDDVKERLRVRAAQNGRSLEAEVREELVQLVRGTVSAVGLPAKYADMVPDENGLIWPDGTEGLPLYALAEPLADPSHTYRREEEYDDNGRC